MDVHAVLIVGNVAAAILVGWLALVLLGRLLDDIYEERALEAERRYLERQATGSLRLIERGPYDWERDVP